MLALTLSTIASTTLLAADRDTPMPVPRPKPAPTTKLDAPAAKQPLADPEYPDAPDPILKLSEFPREGQRQILRHCAVEWDQTKKQSSAMGLIWRDFLTTCLARARS